MNEGALCDESAVSWECITPARPYQLNWFTERLLRSVTPNFKSDTASDRLWITKIIKMQGQQNIKI
jgi:hypothetical protein